MPDITMSDIPIPDITKEHVGKVIFKDGEAYIVEWYQPHPTVGIRNLLTGEITSKTVHCLMPDERGFEEALQVSNRTLILLANKLQSLQEEYLASTTKHTEQQRKFIDQLYKERDT